jgi:hypothetical protein
MMRSQQVLLLVTTLLPGCLTDETVVLTPIRAVVYGTVTSDVEFPVSGIRVAMKADPVDCPATDLSYVNVGTFEAFTDSNGGFRSEVIYLLWPNEERRDFCLHMAITPPSFSGLRDTTVSIGPLHFSSSISDSIRADIVLQPR